MGPDWADGDYTRTAEQLEPIARVVVERLGVGPGRRVLDVGCGTGNASLLAARAGARVTGVDPAAGLVAIARERAAAEGLDVAFVQGDAENLPAGVEFDLVLSVFAAIFAPDAGAASRAMLAVCRPGGTVAITSWTREGAIAAAAEVLGRALPAPPVPPRRWGDPEWATATLEGAGARDVAIDHESWVFVHDSPEAFFAEQEAFHPVWRWARRHLGEPAWEGVRRDSVAALHDGNEDPAAFATTSPYLIIRATR